MSIQELLPIGSVVLLKGGQKRLMIYGVKQKDISTGTEYDYIAVLYPEGNIGDEGHYFFNAGDIERVYFTGMNDGERQKFIAALTEFYAKEESNGQAEAADGVENNI